MLDVTSFKTTDPLEDFSLRASNEMTDFVCDEVFPPLYVDKAQFKRYQYDLSNYRETVTEASSKAAAQKVDYSVFTTSSQAVPHKLAADVDPRDARDADAVVGDMEQDSILTIVERLMIRRERLMVSKVSTAGNYPSGLTSTLGAGLKWSDVGGDPEGDAKTAKIAVKGICGKMANALALSWQAWEALRQSAALKDRLKYTSGQSITEEQVKNLLGLKYLHICSAQYNSNLEGNATQSLSDIWGTYGLFYFKNPDQKRRTLCYGRQYFVTNKSTDSSGKPNGGFYVYTYEDQPRGSGAGRIKVIEHGWEYLLDFATLDSQSSGKVGAGYLLQGII
jgi:hypothetical protein